MRQQLKCSGILSVLYRVLAAALIMVIGSVNCSDLEKLSVMTGVYSGTFSSPGYPKPYPVNVSYTWVFPKYDLDVTLLEFHDVNLYLCYVVDLDEMCDMYDHISIEGFGLPYCNWRTPKGVLVLRQRTVIKFKSFPSREACRGRGFNASFRVVSEKHHDKPTKKMLIPTTSTNPEETTTSPGSVNTVIIIIIAILMALSAMFVIMGVWCWKVRRTRQNRARTTSYSSVPRRGEESESANPLDRDAVSYSELLRNEQRGPPPSYEFVVNDSSQREQLNYDDFENPPTYESAVRERQRSYRERTTRSNVNGHMERESNERAGRGNGASTNSQHNEQSNNQTDEDLGTSVERSNQSESPHEIIHDIESNDQRTDGDQSENIVRDVIQPSSLEGGGNGHQIVMENADDDDSRREIFV